MSDNGLLRMERRAAAAGAHRPRRVPDRKRAYLVGVASVLGLVAAFVGIGFALGSFDAGMYIVFACIALLFGLPFFWSGVIRVVDPTIPVRYAERFRTRMHIGNVEQVVETRGPEQSIQVKRGFSPTMIAVGLVAYAAGVVLLVKAADEPADRAAEAATTAAARAAAHASSPEGQLERATSLPEALALVGTIPDSRDTLPFQMRGFVMWAADHLPLAALEVAPAETTIAQIQRDPAGQRGKRLCITGQVTELEPGLLRVSAHEQVTFVALAKPPLVIDQTARFCGVAMGRHDRTFTAEGPQRTALVVGRFTAAAPATPAER